MLELAADKGWIKMVNLLLDNGTTKPVSRMESEARSWDNMIDNHRLFTSMEDILHKRKANHLKNLGAFGKHNEYLQLEVPSPFSNVISCIWLAFDPAVAYLV